MSKVKELVTDIMTDIEIGELTYSQIAEKYCVDVDMVRSIAVDFVSDFTEYEYDDKSF